MIEGVGEDVLVVFTVTLLVIVLTIVYLKRRQSDSTQSNNVPNEVTNQPSTSSNTTNISTNNNSADTNQIENRDQNMERDETNQEESTSSNSQEIIPIKLQIRETIRKVNVNLDNETVIQLKQREFSREISEGKSVRMFSRGRQMIDSNLIRDYNITPNGTILCILSTGPSSNSSGASNEVSMGPIPLISMCGIILGIFWYIYFMYGERYFSYLSLICLFLFTFIYGIASFPVLKRTLIQTRTR